MGKVYKNNNSVYDVIDSIVSIYGSDDLISHIKNGFSIDMLESCIDDYISDYDLDDEYNEKDRDELVDDIKDRLNDLYDDCKKCIKLDSDVISDLRDICLDYDYLDVDLYYSEICEIDNLINNIVNELADTNDKKELVDELRENGILGND